MAKQKFVNIEDWYNLEKANGKSNTSYQDINQWYNNTNPKKTGTQINQETYADKHPWQAAALSLGQDAVSAVRNNLAELNKTNEASKQALKNGFTPQQPAPVVQKPQPQKPVQPATPQKSFLNDQRYWVKTKLNNVGDTLGRSLAQGMDLSGGLPADVAMLDSLFRPKITENMRAERNQAAVDISKNKETKSEIERFGTREDRQRLKNIQRGNYDYLLNTNEVKSIQNNLGNIHNDLQKRVNAGQIDINTANNLLQQEQDKALNQINEIANNDANRLITADINRKLRNVNTADKVFTGMIAADMAIPLIGEAASIPSLGGKLVTGGLKNALKKELLANLTRQGVTKESAKLVLDKAMGKGLYNYFEKKAVQDALIKKGLYNKFTDAAANVALNSAKGAAIGAVDMGLLGTGMNAYTNYLNLTNNNPLEGGLEGAAGGFKWGGALGGALWALPYIARAASKIPLWKTERPMPNALTEYNPNLYGDKLKYGFNNGKGFYTFQNDNLTRPNVEPEQYNQKSADRKLMPSNIERPIDAEIKDIAPNIAEKQGISTPENTVTEQVPETKPKKNTKLPTIKYKVKVDKNGVTADGHYSENDMYHTDGNAAYLKEFVSADTSKVERVTKFDEKMNNALTSYFESANNYTDKLEDLGKYYIIGKNTKARVFKAGEYDNGEPRYVILNEKYLIDKNNPELYYDTNNKYSAVSIRKNGKQIGIVMPIDARNLKSEEFIDVPKWKKVNPDIAKIAPKTVAKQQGKTTEEVSETKPKSTEKQVKERKTPDKYEDYGEKIEGARKDIWQGYKEKFEKLLPETYEEFTSTKLADVFPDIDGKKFIEAGGNEDTATIIKLLRDSIPTKPSGSRAMRGYYREEWTNKVKEHREYTQKLLNGEMTPDEVVEKLVHRPNGFDYDMGRKADAYRAVGYPACKNLKGYMLNKGEVSTKDEKTGEYKKEERWYITRENRYGLRPFKTREEAVEYLKSVANVNGTATKKEPKLEIGRWNDERKANGYMIYYKAGTGKYIELKNKFETSKDARDYLKEHKEELLDQLSKIKEEPPMRGEVNEPRIGKGFRKGKDVTPEEFSKTFGFRGVQFGNYVEGAKRIDDVNNAYDSLMDMAEVLHLPEKAISLNGELGLAFGARGYGGKLAAAAHYEPSNVVINLTKKRGAGSLAHEWWHGLDNYFGKKNKSRMATESSVVKTPEFREEMAKAYSDVKKAVHNAMFERSKELDKTRSKDYWSTDVEMTARAFETYVKHKIESQGFSNDYLANIVGEDTYKALGRENAYPYPTKAEMKEIEKAFDNFFNTIKTRETEKGVELYSNYEVRKGLNKNNSMLFLTENIFPAETENIEITTIGDFCNYSQTAFLGKTIKDDIKDIPIKLFSEEQIKKYKGKVEASYNPEKNEILVMPDSPIWKVAHEIFHAVDLPKYYKTFRGNLSLANAIFANAVKKVAVKSNSKMLDKIAENLRKNAIIEKKAYKVENIVKRFIENGNGTNISGNVEGNGKFSRKTDKGKRGNNDGKGYGKDFYSDSYKPSQEISGENSNRNSEKTLGEQPNAVKQANETAKNYVREWYAGIEKDRYDVNRSLNSLINITKQKAKDFSSAGLKISDKQIREIMPFLRERTEFPDKLDRPDLKKVWDNLSKSQKAELTKLADSVSEKFEKYYKNYQDSCGVVTENEIENHISHIWDLDKKKTSLLTNYFVTQSKFAKERTIDTLYKGIQGLDVGNGEIVHFTPKTLDYAEILKASSDNLIKATHDMQLANIVKKLKDGKTSLVQSMSKAPADWVEVNHPALNKAIYMGTVGEEETPMIMKTPVKVHPEIARTIQTVFETPATKNDFITGYDKLNSIFKQSQLGFSGFHMVALSESMLGNMGVKETVKLLNPKRIWDEVVKGNWNIYKDDTIAKQAIDDGLQFGATLDLDRNGVEKIADDVSNWVEKRIPVIGKSLSMLPKAFSKVQRLNNTLLWDYLHNNYKLECYKILCSQEGKNRTLTKEERQEIAQWVNDSFGGQVWENLGIKPSGRRTEQRFLLSPDWLRSTTRQFMGMVSNKNLAEKMTSKANESEFWEKAKELGERWGINSNTDDVTASNLRGKIARRFWLRSIVYSAILYNALNAIMRGYDQKKHPELYPEKMTAKDYTLLGNSKGNKTYVFVGRNKDGSERYLRLGKQFREVPEMAENPLKKLGGKASPNIQLISQLATGHTASGFQNKDLYVDKYPYNQMKEGKDRLKASGKVIAKSFMPYSLNTLFNPDADWTPLSLFAPVSKGMTKGKGRMAYEKDLYNEKSATEITRAMLRNNISREDIDKTYKQARTNVRSAYKNMYIEAIETGNEQKVIEVTRKLKKKGLSNDEINYIYNKALEE